MSYSTQADLIAFVGETELISLTDLEGTGEIDSARVAQAIADADAVIDPYLANRYTVPVDPVTERLRIASMMLAYYNLHTLEVTDLVQERYEQQIAWCEGVATGQFDLVGAQTSASSSDSAGTPAFEVPELVWGDDGLDGY